MTSLAPTLDWQHQADGDAMLSRIRTGAGSLLRLALRGRGTAHPFAMDGDRAHREPALMARVGRLAGNRVGATWYERLPDGTRPGHAASYMSFHSEAAARRWIARQARHRPFTWID
ncbi:hypothetical protein M0638_01055 [Roseomonas sp. NAR14]|uniref:Uncharacterized protein n=1 Tax=Roseomonas acroporae TaxID=2937791 RepID=A0A9X2BRU5_9PROT|nr:hypothetical protein [Roseomonas acroporae]MCK8782968.1 hypothetical protein [Roseomonas acroporae]